ncbi:MAG: chromate transporter [Clostridiales bacterium]|nr:chromate transporter [Clostridiales bacterium]
MENSDRSGRLFTLFLVMAKIGCFTFGGGWSIVTQMQNEFVERRGWMTEEEIVDYLSLAKSFPGIMIVNMSVISGYSMAGIPGAFAAACGLVFPAFITISIVTYFYVYLKSNLYAQRILNGVRSAVVPIILSAALKLKSRSLIAKKSWVLMIASFVLCAFTDFSKVLLILAGALLGLLLWSSDDVKEEEVGE